MPLLRTRLRPPRLPPGALDRPALVERALRGVERGRLLVVAGAGYGKSTLLAQTVERAPFPAVWCSCDARMAETPALLRHVTAGFEEVIPGFGASLRLEGTAFEQVAGLCNEIDLTVVDPVLLVLDDVHELIGHPAQDAFALLVEHIPATIRLLIGGRGLPQLPMPRLRAQGLEEIGAAELALEPSEVGAISASLGITLDREQVHRLHLATEGWVAGVLLAGRGRDLDVARAVNQEAMFDYLASEVLGRQAPEVMRVMEATAILSRFTPGLARQVSGVGDADTIIRDLATAQMFTTRLEGGDWYRYHHLLRDYLRRRLDQDPPERSTGLHLRAGRAWAALGEPLEAARHFVEAGRMDEAADVLEGAAESIGAGPDGPSLAGLLDAMPTDAWIDRPALVSAQAALQFHLGNHERGFALSEESIRRLIELGEDDRAAAALTTHVMGLAISGVPPQARLRVAAQYLPDLRPCAMRPVLQVMHASSLASAGRRPEALQLLADARAAVVGEGPPVGHFADIIEGFYIDAHAGRPSRGIELLERGYRELDGYPGTLAMRFRLFASGVVVQVLLNQGRWSDALEATERSVNLAARFGVSSVDRSSQWWRLVALAGLERWEDLDARLERAERAVGVSASHYGYRQRGQAALLAATRGDRAAVVVHADSALKEIEDYGESYDHPWVLCDLSTALHRVDESPGAVDLARRALRISERGQLPWEEARSSLRLAVCDRSDDSDPALERALVLTGHWGFDDLGIRRERRDAAVPLARAISRGIGPDGLALRLALACGGEVTEAVVGYLEGAPARVRVRLAEALAAAGAGPETVGRLLSDTAPAVRTAARSARARGAARPRPPIHVRAIGGLSVERDGVPVPGSAFGRDKARQLLAALLSAVAPTHREVLLEWLWPDLDTARATRAFHVTLHALRRTLEPDLQPRAPSSLVALEGDTYRVVLADGDRFDVAELLELARTRPGEASESRIARLERATTVPPDEVFPEWPYAEWATGIRDRVAAARRDVRHTLGRLLIEVGRPAEAATQLAALVGLEPEREEWHRLLMQAQAAAGERALALRQFHACRAHLRRELAIDVSAETRALYTRILQDEPETAAAPG